MDKLQTVRGTHDLYGEEIVKFNFIEQEFKKISQLYGFKEIRTPIFEYATVFEKNIGETTDIISKEMYTFVNKSGELLCLRPEGTAPTIRALYANGLVNKLPLKWFYIGPMFRYERPQQGRQRQFHQLGLEYLGTNNYSGDIECISLAVNFLQRLDIKDYTVLINSLGSAETLQNYKAKLVKYLQDNKNKLSSYSLVRLEKNPLRVLDSKEEEDKLVIENAPKISASFTVEDKEFVDNVKKGLQELNINYTEDDTLVRGLDYYTHTVFEITTNKLGAQNTLIAGGRYNNLVKDMGGTTAGAFGFAAGIERLALLLSKLPPPKKAVAIISTSLEHDLLALKLARKLYSANIISMIIQGKNIDTKFKKTTSQEHACIVILGDDEHINNQCKVKDITTYQQQIVNYDDLPQYLTNKYNEIIKG